MFRSIAFLVVALSSSFSFAHSHSGSSSHSVKESIPVFPGSIVEVACEGVYGQKTTIRVPSTSLTGVFSISIALNDIADARITVNKNEGQPTLIISYSADQTVTESSDGLSLVLPVPDRSLPISCEINTGDQVSDI